MCPLINHKRDSVYSGSIAEMLIKNPLLHIGDLYENALRLLVVRILDHGDVQFFLVFAERDVSCAITRGDLKYV